MRGGREDRERLRRCSVGHMHDQRIEGGPALGRVYPRHRLARSRVGGEAIDCLGGDGHRLAGADQGGRFDERCSIVGEDQGFVEHDAWN